MFVFRGEKRKGFSLVELVIVVIIIAVLAVAVFSGGSAVIKKSQISRSRSDLYNFSIATESFLNENPSVANAENTEKFADIDSEYVRKLNRLLPVEYRLKELDKTPPPGIQILSQPSSVVYQSMKRDAWDNPYYVVFDYEDRHQEGSSDFYITVISAGPDAMAVIGGTIGSDDLFMLTQYSSGAVTSAIYNTAHDTVGTVVYDKSSGKYILKRLAGGSYSGATNAPVTERVPSDGSATIVEWYAPSPSYWFSTDDAGCITGLTDDGKDKEKISIPGKINGHDTIDIGDGAFKDSTKITAACIPSGTKRIGKRSFENCEVLEELMIPKSIKTIDFDAFSGCKSITTIKFAGSMEEWNRITFKGGNEALADASVEFGTEY